MGLRIVDCGVRITGGQCPPYSYLVSSTHPTAQHSALSTQHYRKRLGYTLVELVASMAVTTIVLAGIGSAIFIAARGVDASSPVASLIESGRVADQLAGELACATGFTVRSADVVEFQVPDRDGDDVPETIRYEWSGTAGDPLTRRYNGGTVVDVLDDVYAFSLAYVLIEFVPEPEGEPTENENDEELLFSFDATEDLNNFRIKWDRWPGEFFHPSLPGDAISWKVTRLKFLAKKKDDDSGSTQVQLRLPAPDNSPGPAVLETQPMPESSLGDSYAWQEFSFDNVSGLLPYKGLCLVLEHVDDDDSAEIRYQDSGASTPNAAKLKTINAGTTWTSSHDKAMDLYVWGTVTTLVPPEPGPSTYRLNAVNVSLRTGQDAGAVVVTSVEVLNTPEVTEP